ncbi:MAG: hypothetical protein HDQ99_02525 [Lachnospiraceae bacterium]|nr:hypothetical protein [Lachnospiraceae bacterium]
MSKFENEWYNKGYEDGFSDAINNLSVDDILEHIENLSDNERQQIIETIKYK